MQNSDLLLILGCRLNIRQVGYNWQSFARSAFKIQIDANNAEFEKPMVKIDWPIITDLKLFLEELSKAIDRNSYDKGRHSDWLAWCRDRLLRYPAVLSKHRMFSGRINPYHFFEILFNKLSNNDVVVCGNATACIVPFQVAFIRKGQRLFSNSGSASMGYDLPASIGAAFGRDGKRVICIAGDGSIQLNIQELQTIKHYQLPIKIFVLNNNGYLSIRATQSNFFGRFVGEGPQSGVTFPDIVKVASAYGIPACRADGPDFQRMIDEVLRSDGPMLCEVMIDDRQMFEPRVSSRQLHDGRIVSSTLEDMFPFLDREELLENLLISPVEL